MQQTPDQGGHGHDDEEPFEMIEYHDRRRITEEDTQLVIPRFTTADDIDTGNPSRILPQN